MSVLTAEPYDYQRRWSDALGHFSVHKILVLAVDLFFPNFILGVCFGVQSQVFQSQSQSPKSTNSKMPPVLIFNFDLHSDMFNKMSVLCLSV